MGRVAIAEWRGMFFSAASLEQGQRSHAISPNEWLIPLAMAMAMAMMMMMMVVMVNGRVGSEAVAATLSEQIQSLHPWRLIFF